MKNKLILTGILNLALVFGLGMVLASCELEPQTAEITVTNNSSFDSDSTVIVRIHVSGRGDPLATQNCARGQSVTFSLDEGEFQVRVTGGGGSFYYPQDSNFTQMKGNVRLSFDGSAVTRTN